MTTIRLVALLCVTIVLAVAATATTVLGGPCVDFFQVSSGPDNKWLGLHTSGVNYAQGQSFSLNCDARLESVAFSIYWGNDAGDVRSLAFGDTIQMSILTLDGKELARQGWMVDTNVGNRTVTYYFHGDDVQLHAGTYLATCWTAAPACGGMEFYDTDLVVGSHYETPTPDIPSSWVDNKGEMIHTIVMDTSVTPTEASAWGVLKATYR